MPATESAARTEPPAPARAAAADDASDSIRLARQDLYRLQALAHMLSNAIAPLVTSVEMLAAEPSGALPPRLRLLMGAALGRAKEAQAQLAELKQGLHTLD
ncbi:MAG TPA: hypothetical protein VII06_28220 [Chloroflexota bacterium]|jgi:hypothetical protein